MKILHLYHDIMNLYGDYANIAALKKLLQSNGIEVTVDKLSIGDEVRLFDYDFIYIGSGTERNLKVILSDLRRLEPQLIDCIGSGKVMLMTGNSFEALGKELTDADGRIYEGLGVFGFTSAEQNRERIVGDVICDAPFLSSPLVGFINKCSDISGIDEPMLTLRMGPGNKRGSKGEGIRLNDLICTHVTGPVLVKNPHFLKYIGELITGAELDDSALVYEKKGYTVTLGELSKRLGNPDNG